MNSIDTVRVVELTEPAELYRRYQGQFEVQPAYIELDLREGVLLASYNAEVGNAIPFAVHHGFDRRYGIPTLTAAAANRLMDEIKPLAARILADWEEHWDGNNHVARLGADAIAADEAIDALVARDWTEDDLVVEWDVDGATNGDEAGEYKITATTTDERLDEIEAAIAADMAQMSDSNVVVLHGVDEYLRNLRDELKAEADEAAEDDDPTPDSFSITLDRSGELKRGDWNWAEAATEQWLAEAERLGFGVSMESEEVPNPDRHAAIIRRDDETLWVLNVSGDGTIRAEALDEDNE